MPIVSGQKFVANYDETKIPTYTLPPVLQTEDGSAITDAKQWPNRRAEILDLFASQVYGRSPEPCVVESRPVGKDIDVFGGTAVRRQVEVFIADPDRKHPVRVLIFAPKSDKPVPAFLTLNFQGNHTVDPSPGITIAKSWVRNRNNETTKGNQATAEGRGVAANRWPAKMITDRGYALITLYYGDLDPDYDDGFQNGIHARFPDFNSKCPEGQRWGSIAGWAYGLSRVMDFIETDQQIDAKRVAVFGHSRLGKTSLWAGANDSRFKVVISNNSGCGGAALCRRAIGETVGRINTSFPHWFCDNFTKYNLKEDTLPVDQHQLIAAIAPRAVYVASAAGDKWADPKGEFLSAKHADPVYRLLGTDGMGGDAAPQEMPAVDQPINSGVIGYHIRQGKHDVTDFDWQQYLDFADRNL